MRSGFEAARKKMVREQILNRGINDSCIIDAFSNVPRHLFVPAAQKKFAYQDYPLDIGENQTISQPYIVALMTQALDVRPGLTLLEVGGGSGYQAAILCYLGAKVYSIERLPVLARRAREVLDSLGYAVAIKVGDGTLGWPEQAPYDRIIVTAASPRIPQALVEQLKISGKLVIPVGERFRQDLILVDKIAGDRLEQSKICGCVFVPLIGKEGWS